ncbi:MAG: hypothetical protein O4965_31745 [Trichodesmium sp. St19_bin1]|nr:hypothetical protein [Trichodesmium sp. St19_bin1]
MTAAREMSTRLGATARLFPRAFRPGKMSINSNLDNVSGIVL